MSITPPTTFEIFGKSAAIQRAIERADRAAASLFDTQVRHHESLRIFRFAADEMAAEELAVWAYQVEDIAEIRRLAVQEAVKEIADRDKRLAQQAARISALVDENRSLRRAA